MQWAVGCSRGEPISSSPRKPGQRSGLKLAMLDAAPVTQRARLVRLMLPGPRTLRAASIVAQVPRGTAVAFAPKLFGPRANLRPDGVIAPAKASPISGRPWLV